MPRQVGRLVLLALLSACGRSSKAEGNVSKAPASVTSLASASPLVAPSSNPARRLDLHCNGITVVEAGRALVTAWNVALNAHDAEALAGLYAPQVSFYGRSFSRAQVLAAKSAALAVAPAFKQQLSKVRIAPEPLLGARVTFEKSSAGAKTVQARLLVHCTDDGVYAITAESDAPSDELGAAKEGCEDAMYSVAFGLPEVTKELANATDGAPFGSVSYPVEGTHYSLSLGFHHPDRFEAIFFVDWLNDAFTIQEGADPLPVPPAALARVKSACPK
jgi:hypothetical protein